MVRPPVEITIPRPITFTSLQIQYSQEVFSQCHYPYVAARFGSNPGTCRSYFDSFIGLELNPVLLQRDYEAPAKLLVAS